MSDELKRRAEAVLKTGTLDKVSAVLRLLLLSLETSRATALEAVARAVGDTGPASRAIAAGIRALAPLPATLVVVERAVLERVLYDDQPEAADIATLKGALK